MSKVERLGSAAAAEDWNTMALVGRVARAHGNRGEVIINPESDFPEERFRVGRVLYLYRQDLVEPLMITAVRMHRGRPIVALEGIRTMDDAESLASAELRVPTEELERLPAGMYYRHDLVGCRVVTRRGIEVGTVTSVEGPLERSRLVVQGTAGEILIPLVAEICRQIDVRAGRIVVEPLEGLLELNQPEERLNARRKSGERRTENVEEPDAV